MKNAKNIILLLMMCLCQLNCSKKTIFNINIKSKKTNLMKENEKRDFEKNKIIDQNNNFSYTYKVNDSLVHIIEYPDSFLKSVKKNDNYRSDYIYDKKTGLITKDKFYFLDAPVGIHNDYDKDGNIIKSLNVDEGYIFTIQQLIDKMLNEYNIDLNEKNNSIRFYKLLTEDNLPRYYLYYLLNDKYGSKRLFIIDGITGDIISDKVGMFEKD